MSHCPNCGKKISMSKAFCSRSCKEEYFHKIQIQIPEQFTKRLCQKCNSAMRERELEKFAENHKFKIDLVKERFRMEVEKLELEFHYA